MNTDTTKKVQAAEVTFADDAFSPLPEGALDQDQIARKKTTYFKDTAPTLKFTTMEFFAGFQVEFSMTPRKATEA